MRKVRQAVAIVMAAVFTGLASPVLAAQQSHALDTRDMAAALAERSDATTAARTSVLEALDTPEAAAAAERLGMDLADARSAVATLDGAELAQLANYAAQADEARAGGANTVVISTTTLLLVLIIVILLVK
ncbi:MAG: hypothetical protein AB7H88_18850 [Vicinamibacterales bacterium]